MANLPAPTEVAFYAAGPAGQAGPMTSEQLLADVAAGRLPEDVLVWWPDAPEWAPLNQQPEMTARLAQLRMPAPTMSNGDPSPAPAATATPDAGVAAPAAAPAHVPQAAAASDDELDRVFAGLVKDSWKYHHLVDDTTRVDDVLLGALITSTLDTGHVLIDLTSDGTNHFVRFEDPADRSRLTMAITHLTRSVTQAKTIGQRASVVVGYGEPIKSFGKVFSAMRQEAKSGYLQRVEPGVVSFDADSASQYLYAQIDLYLDIDKFIGEDFVPDYAELTKHVAATVHALRKFLHGRIS